MSFLNSPLTTELIDFSISPLDLSLHGPEFDYRMEEPTGLTDEFLLPEQPTVSNSAGTNLPLSQLGKIPRSKPPAIAIETANANRLSASPVQKGTDAHNAEEGRGKAASPLHTPKTLGRYWAYSAKIASFLYRKGAPPDSPPKGYSSFSRMHPEAEPLVQPRGRFKPRDYGPDHISEPTDRQSRRSSRPVPYRRYPTSRGPFGRHNRSEDDINMFTERFGHMLTQRRNLKVADRIMEFAEDPSILERLMN
jgi:hypothetical protein